MVSRAAAPHRANKTRVTAMAIVTAIVALAITLGGLVGCSAPQTQEAAETASATTAVIDRLGRTVEVPGDVERVVAVGCALRPICYLQAVDKVVGVEKAEHEDIVSCAYRHVNHEAFSRLPIIGEGGSKGVTPNAEAIISASPQVVVAASLKADEADALQEKTGIPVVCIDVPEAVFGEEFSDNLTFLGEVLGKQERAAEVRAYLEGIEQDLSDRAARSSAHGSVTAYAAGISYRGGHGFDGTEANFAPFNACGVTNIADGKKASGAFTIDLEAVSAAQPNFVFVECGNLDLVKSDYEANPHYFAALDAVRDGRVATLISYRFYATNIETALANCYQVGSTVYPDTFSDVDPTEKLDEISGFFLGAPLSSDLAEQGYTFKRVDLSNL